MSYSKDTQQVFEDWATNGRAEGMERGHKTRALQALEQIPLATGDRVLDLGCGNGWATRWLLARAGDGSRATGIDVAPAMLARAARQSEGLSGINFTSAAFDELPWPDASFDHAFSMEALYYAPDLPAALRSVARVLRPGGTLTSCIDFFEENPYSAGWPAMLNVTMLRLSVADWCAAFGSAGFVVDACFRCYDPRPADPAASEQEQRETTDFRQNIGSLAIRGRVPIAAPSA